LSQLITFPIAHPRLVGLLAIAILGPVLLVTFDRGPETLAARRQAQLELAEQLEELFAAVAEEVRSAVVAIDTTDSDAFGDSNVRALQASFGSGFIVDARGYILTNHHLVSSADSIRVRLYSGEEYPGVLVQSDAASDIALLKIEAKNVSVARLGDSDDLRVGQWGLAIGHPFGLMQTVSAGIISALKRSDLRILPFEDFIQTDASINPGNSGGPLVNLHGEVIGINTAIYSSAGSMNHGISFAVPINLAHILTKRWIAGKSVATIGLSAGRVDSDMATYYGLDRPHGAFVKSVEKEGPASKSGLRPMDVVVRFGKTEVLDENHLRILIAKTAPGTSVPVEFRRGRETKSCVVVPQGAAAPPRADRATPDPAVQRRWLGITVTALNESLARELLVTTTTRGVAVVNVHLTSASWKKGIRPGDVITSVNGSAVTNLREFDSSLMSSENVVALQVTRKGRDIGYFFVSRGA